jgi:hypothetical protein
VSETIGRADYELRARIDQLKADLKAAEAELAASGSRAESEYTDRSSRWGPILASGMKVGVKAVASAAAGMFAIATKGATELTDAQLEYQAQTGASAEEAERAGKSIANLARGNTESFRELSDVLIAVTQNLGLVGDEAETAAQQALDFAKVTRQNAVAVVKQFDDVMDAWNLTAADQGLLMDKLFRSQQKYGGEIATNTRVLAQMAPAMRAANMTVDDGIALLNLFASSGLDASTASAAFTRALANVKSPAELQRLVADIAATEDPFKRARLAAELFGERAGAKLANALHPGSAALADFAITNDDAAGAVKRASDTIDEQLGNRVKLALKQVTVPLAEFGKELGPAVTGIASLGSVLAALKLDRALLKVWGALIASAPVKAAAGAAGAVAGTVYAAAVAAPGRLAGALVGSFGRITVDTSVKAAATKAGISMGTALGTAAAAALAAVLIAKAVETFFEVRSRLTEQGQALASQTTEFVRTASREQIQAALDSARSGLVDIKRLQGLALSAGPLSGLLMNATKGAEEGLVQTVRELEAALERAGSAAEAPAQGFGREVADQIRRGFVAKATEIGPLGIRPLREYLTRGELETLARAAGNRAGEGLARGILDARQKPVDAFTQMVEMLKAPLSKTAEVTRLLGQLASKELQEALASRDPAIRAWAAHTKQSIIDRLYEIKPHAGIVSRDAARLLEQGFKSRDTDIRAAAENIKKLIEGQLKTLPTAAGLWGEALARQYADGIRRKATLSTTASQQLANNVRNVLQVRSPAKEGPFAEMGGPEGWGERWASLWSRGLRSGLGGMRDLLGGLVPSGALQLAAQSGLTVPPAAGSQGAGGLTVQVNGGIHLNGIGSDVSPAAARRFGQSIMDEIAGGLREQHARAGLTVLVGSR